MILARWRARRASIALIEQLRGEIVAASRRPALYLALEAPDRVDGRFELLTLHVGLVLRRLVALGGLGDDIAQDLVNAVFMHLDDTLREQALSDLPVSKRLEDDEGGLLRPQRRLRRRARFGLAGRPRRRARAQRLRRAGRRAEGGALADYVLRSRRRWRRRRSRISPRAGSGSRTVRSTIGLRSSPEVEACRSRSAASFGSTRCRRTARP